MTFELIKEYFQVWHLFTHDDLVLFVTVNYLTEARRIEIEGVTI